MIDKESVLQRLFSLLAHYSTPYLGKQMAEGKVLSQNYVVTDPCTFLNGYEQGAICEKSTTI